MKIVYDDISELAEVVIRCEKTIENGECEWCPFYDRCQLGSLESRPILCAEIEPPECRNENEYV